MRNVLFLSLCLLLLACSPVKLSMYEENTPKLKVREFFNGRLEAAGIVKNRSGKVIRYFNASIEATWNNGVGTLDEVFSYSDGETQNRVWTLKEIDSNTFKGTANDVIGSTTLRTAGNALFMNYVLEVPYKGSTINLTVDDRMYLLNDSTLINESIMTKFGFEAASVTLYIRKL